MTAPRDEEFSPPSRRQFATNIVASVGARLLLGVAGLVVTGILARAYTIETIGLWVLVSGVFAYLSLADFGLFSSLPRAIPALQVTKRHGGPSAAIGMVAGLSLGMMLLMFGIAVPMGDALVDLYNVSGPMRDTAGSLFLVVFLVGGLSLPLRLGVGVLKAVHRFDLVFLTNSINALARMMLVAVLALLLGVEFYYVAVLLLCAPLVSMAAQCGLSLRFMRPAFPSRSSIRGLLPGLFSISAASLAMSFAVATMIQGPAMVASYHAGPEFAAAIALPLLLATSLMTLVRSSAAMQAPVASGLSAQEDGEGVRERYLFATRAYASVAGGAAALLIAVAPFFLNVWLGTDVVPPEMRRDMVVLVQIFVLSMALATPGMVARVFLMACGRHWQASMVEIGSAVLGLALGAVLFVGGYGIVGLGIGVCLTILVSGVFILPSLIVRYLNCSPRGLIKQAIAGPFTVTVISSALAAWFSLAYPEQPFVVAFVAGAVVGIVWLALTLTLVLTRDQRLQAWRHLRGLAGIAG